MAQNNPNLFYSILPHGMTPHHDVPIATLVGLLDLLDALDDELTTAPGIIPLLGLTLREELQEVVSHDH
jgi:hypothetical protein